MDFATLVREKRHQKGLTLQNVADKIGTEKGYVSGFENKKVNPPSPKLVKKLAKLLDIDETLLLVYSFVEKAPPEIRDLVKRASLDAWWKNTKKCRSCGQDRCVCDMGHDVTHPTKTAAAAV